MSKRRVHALPSSLRPKLRPCGPSEYLEGEWREAVDSAMPVLPPCCGWDDLDYRWPRPRPRPSVCTNATPEQGVLQSATFGKVPKVGSHACSCTRFTDRLRWVPSKCLLREWDIREFCTLLGQRRILFVGDSTMQQTANAVMSQVVWDLAQLDSAELEKASLSGCETRLSFGPSDQLLPTSETQKLRRGGRHTLLHWVRTAQASIVILSTGAHVRHMPEFQSIVRGIHNLSSTEPELNGVKLIWKTQQPAGCASQPLESMPGAGYWESARGDPGIAARVRCESLWGRCHNNSHGMLYNWPEFLERDAFAMKYVAGVAGKGAGGARPMPVLDLRPLYRRADAHVGSQQRGSVDCLHFCMPGPLNTLVPQLLLHLMRSAGI